VALGALNQCRILGGGIGLAVNARLLTSHILSTSSSVLSSEIRHGLARNPEVAGHLTSGLIEVEARKLLNEGFNHGFIFQACAAAIAFLAILLAFENHAV
jgi:hypothetical protein